MANKLLFKTYGEISKLPGSTLVQAELVELGLKYLGGLAREAKGDPALQRELAAAFEQFGNVQGYSSAGELGVYEAAAQSYRGALKIRQALADSKAGDWQARYDLAVVHRKLGEALTKIRQLDEARAHCEQALRLIEALVAARPQDQRIRQEQYFLHRRLGLLINRNLEKETALKHIQQAQTLLGSLAQSEKIKSDGPEASVENYDRGVLLQAAGDLPGALAQFQQRRDSLEAVLRREPDNLRAKVSLGNAHILIADVLEKMGRREEAVNQYRVAVTFCAGLPAQDLADARLRELLSESHTKLGVVLERMDRREEAIEHYRAVIAIYADSPVKEPADARIRYILRTAHAKLGAILKVSAPVEAMKHLGTALEIDEALDARNLSDATALRFALERKNLAEMATELGDSASAIKHWQAAREWRKKSLAIFLDMRERGMLPVSHTARPEEIEKEITRCDTALAKLQASPSVEVSMPPSTRH